MLTSPGTISTEFTTADARTVNHSEWKPTDKMGSNGNSTIDEQHLHESVQASNLTDSEASIDETQTVYRWLQTISSHFKDLINYIFLFLIFIIIFIIIFNYYL